MSRRRRLSNIIGLFVLGTIIIGVVLHRTTLYLLQREEDRKALVAMDELGQRVARHDSAATMSWARGEHVDPWGNSFVLVQNDPENGVQFYSKGKDGELGTEDDLPGRVFRWEEPAPPDPIVLLKPKPLEEEKPSLGTRVKDGFTKVRNFFKEEE